MHQGNAEKNFLSEAARIINLYNNDTPLKSIALKRFSVFLPMMLQKSSHNSKAKNHCKYLQKRLQLWKNGDLRLILNDCCEIEKRLDTAQSTSMSSITKRFTQLLLLGKLSQASKLINKNNHGPLSLNDDVCKVSTSSKALYC